MLQQYKEGVTTQQLARKHSISRRRVQQVILQASGCESGSMRHCILQNTHRLPARAFKHASAAHPARTGRDAGLVPTASLPAPPAHVPRLLLLLSLSPLTPIFPSPTSGRPGSSRPAGCAMPPHPCNGEPRGDCQQILSSGSWPRHAPLPPPLAADGVGTCCMDFGV